MKINEENGEIEFEETLPSRNFTELYGQYGSWLFSEEGIEELKKSGLWNDEKYIPISYEDDLENNEIADTGYDFDLNDIHHVDFGLYKDDVFLDYLKRYINKIFPEGLEIALDSDDLSKFSDFSKFSDSFIEGLMCGELFEFFSGFDDYYYSFSDAYSSYLITDKIKEELKRIGLPEDIYEKINNDEYEDIIDEELKDSLTEAYMRALSDAREIGSENACLRDFAGAMADAVPTGCKFVDSSDVRYVYLIGPEYMINRARDIFYNMDYDDFEDSTINTFKSDFEDGLNFREPYNGWDDSDDDAFEESLLEQLSEFEHVK